MRINLKWWSYPYIFFKNNYIPFALLFMFLQFILLFFVVYMQKSINCRDIAYMKIDVEWGKKKKKFLILYGLIAGVLFAFAQTDSSYILYKLIQISSQTIRQIDAFIYVIMLALFFKGIKFKNSYTYLNKFVKYYIVANTIELIMIFFQQYNQQENGYIRIIFQITIASSIVIINSLLEDVKFINNATKVLNIYQEKEELFEIRKSQLDEIYRKIEQHKGDEQITILISDEWGGGKTFFAKELFNKLNKTKRFNAIWINMNDFDESETLVKQIFHKIYSVLSENGYYTGNSSEFEAYLQSVFNIILDESISDMLSIKFDKLGESKSKTLSEISKEFSEMLGDERIIIIIDDMDRCTEKTISDAVKLLSEILYIPKSIIIFAGDYKHLLGKNEFKDGFFDKYFMYNYNLNSIPYDFLLEYYQRKYKDENLKLPNMPNVSEEIKKMIIAVKKEKNEEENQRIYMNNLEKGDLKNQVLNQSMALEDNLEIAIKSLEKCLSNPRRVIGIYNEIYDQFKSLDYALGNVRMDTEVLQLKLNDVIYPAIMFYGLARIMCSNHFWDISVEDFLGFKEDILNTLSKMDQIIDNNEDYVYMLLVHYFFSSKYNKDKSRINKISNYYKIADVCLFLEQ